MTVVDLLEYSQSRQFLRPGQIDRLPPSELTFALRLAEEVCLQFAGTDAASGFQGVYVLQKESTEPAVPVVYVVQVDTDEAARQVHRFVWNQNSVPFLIVESPSTIRLYPGFSYDRDGDDSLLIVAHEAADVLERFSAFRSEFIDDGRVWQEWGSAVDPSRRVDEALLRDLKELDQKLQTDEGLSRSASHGLIGKYVYLRYLRDRKILSPKKLAKWGLTDDALFSRKATLTAFWKVNEELEDWLNGSVFTLGDEALKAITASQLKLVAGVFFGDSPDGQASLFDAYDFSYIPIETLSCVYEQFLHDAKGEDGKSRGKKLGAYYTPIPLTDYMISELDTKKRLQPGMKVLDPACGSGTFLVQSYRRLVERQRRVEQRPLKATEVRELLTKSIYGIDKDDDACRVAELSLILTLLDYVHPPDLENTSFKLPTLRDNNIFQGDFFDASGPVCEFLTKQSFDWIVGNPPWAEVKRIPPPDHEHRVAWEWIKRHERESPTSGNQIAEAFLWKSGEHLADGGAASLVVPAMTWFKKEGGAFRRAFFSSRKVWCLANFANLAYVLFAGRSERPASVLFFERGMPNDDDVVLSFAPFVAEQIANRPQRARHRLFTWNIVVNGNDLREIEYASATAGDSLTWKLAMWGSRRDRKLLQRLKRRYKTIESLGPLGVGEPHQGFELRTAQNVEKGQLDHRPDLIGKKKLLFERLRNAGRIFAFPTYAIGRIERDECFIRTRGGFAGLDVSSPPHIVLDAARRFAVFSDEFLAVPPRQVGIAGKDSTESILRALSLYLSSDFCRYHQFFLSPKWGVDESLADLDTLKQLPIPITDWSGAGLREWSQLQKELAALSHDFFEGGKLADHARIETERLTVELNDGVYKALGLRAAERWLVEDFIHVHLQLNKGKTTAEVLRHPTDGEIRDYLRALRECLDGFLSPSREARHRIRVLAEKGAALIEVSAVTGSQTIEPTVMQAGEEAAQSLLSIRDRLRSKHGQWLYFDRNLNIYRRGMLYRFKPMQRLHWTRRQAVLDADEIIADTLTKGGRDG